MATIDESKNKQASEIIAKQISSINENEIMDFGTLGHTNGLTKRQGEAMSMAKYFVKNIYRSEYSDDSYEFALIIKDIADAAIEICGK